MTGAGDLRERVAFDARAAVDDGHGNERSDFVEQFPCRASFTPLRGGETVIASRLEGRQPVVVRVRASSKTRRIATDWRMRDLRTGFVYAVRSVIETSDRTWVDVTVESGVAA
ncbi:head-tail adaptor protein [Ciceribacter thiooxidans]|uniref:Head-tail adaptor protein n=1 Tax=Ciceribacter thiooxidans TaxID=1969821 RepID=A0ABV7HXC0_9HYPH|nr:head-tail adaptor protein [Ciceribacter thiooxidans]